MWQTDQRDDYQRDDPIRFGRIDYQAGLVGREAFSIVVLIRSGFRAFFQRFLLSSVTAIVLAGLKFLPWMIVLVVTGPLQSQLAGAGVDQNGQMAFAAVVGGLLFALLLPVQMFVESAYIHSVAMWIGKERRDVATIAESGGFAVRYILANAVTTVLSGGILVALCIPALGLFVVHETTYINLEVGGWFLLAPFAWLAVWAHAGLMQAPFAAALDNLNPLDAIRRSWQLSNGPRIGLTLWWSNTRVLLFIGLCCSCGMPLGAFLVPLYSAGLTATWILASRDLDDTNKMRFFRTARGRSRR